MTTFYLINISRCSMYSSVHCLRQSTSCCSRLSVEQLASQCCPPLSPSSVVILNHICEHFLVPLSDTSLICAVSAQWLTILDTIVAIAFVNIFSLIAIHCFFCSSCSAGTTAYRLCVAAKPERTCCCMNSLTLDRSTGRVLHDTPTFAGLGVHCLMHVGHLYFEWTSVNKWLIIFILW